MVHPSLKTKALAVRTANGGSWKSGGCRLMKSCRGDRGLGGGGKAKLDSTGTHRAPTLVNVGVQKLQESPEYPAKHSQERVASWHTPLPPHTCTATLLFSKLNQTFFVYFDPENICLRYWEKKIGLTWPIVWLKQKHWYKPVQVIQFWNRRTG